MKDDTTKVSITKYDLTSGKELPGATLQIIDKDGNEIPFDDTLPIPDGMEAPEGYQLVAVETGVSDANNTEIFWGVDEGATVYLNATPNTSDAVTDEENTAYNS